MELGRAPSILPGVAKYGSAQASGGGGVALMMPAAAKVQRKSGRLHGLKNAIIEN